jgi:hypothetical protein
VTEDFSFADLVAPIRDLNAGDALTSWRWLCGDDATPLLLTALGDMFTELPTGEVAFLDTYEGTFGVVAPSQSAWKEALRQPENVERWFTPDLVAALRESGQALPEGQCYSPDHPLILGGAMEPDNFTACHWRVHVGVMGQIYEQTRNLPEGTPITGITWKKE